MSQEEWGESV